jgi:glycolate oxidase
VVREVKMHGEDSVSGALVNVVGKEFVSNRQEELYIYSRDGGTSEPRKVDYVVMPKTTEEIQEIVRLVNERRIPITPMGAGLTLNGLTLPVHGGIVMDMKRMDKIIEVNEISRYVVIEAGVSQGALLSYLRENYPDLHHSLPASPHMASVVGNLLIRGHGTLGKYGDNSDMINGMEVVLPTGQICKIGSCSVSPYWFDKGPLPDLAGLFVGWLGITGIVTKLSLRLYPRPKKRDILVFSMENPDLIPELVYKIIQSNIADDVRMLGQEKPEWLKGHQFISTIIFGNSEEEIEYKRKVLSKIPPLCGDEGNKVTLIEETPEAFKQRYLEQPPFAAVAADYRKGGGFQYCGGIIPLEKVPQAWRRGVEIAHKHEMLFSCANQVMGYGHRVMFGFNYSFNRADERDIELARKAMDDSNKLVLELGGIPWKAGLQGQKLIMERMDTNTLELMKKIKQLLDPNGIMNPGNWGD